MEYKGIEMKVGLVIFICMIMLVALLIAVGGRGIIKKTYEVKVGFAFTDGLENNAPVRFAGVEVGKVSGIRVIPETDMGHREDMGRVEVTLRVDKGLILHHDSRIRLGTLGLMGGKYVSLYPGTIDSPTVKPGEILRGDDPMELSELIEEGKSVLTNLGNITTDLNNLISANKEYIDEAIVNIRDVSRVLSENLEDVLARLENLLDNTDQLIASNREDIRDAVKNLKEMTRNAKEFTRKINEKPNALIWGYKEKGSKRDERR